MKKLIILLIIKTMIEKLNKSLDPESEIETAYMLGFVDCGGVLVG